MTADSVWRRTFAALAIATLAACGTGPGSPDAPAAAAVAERAEDPAVRAAGEALVGGAGWHATQLVAPALADTARRTPDAVYLAAAAAARWGGWREVRDLLRGETWLDTAHQGGGAALLARAELEVGDAVAAAELAFRAVAAADDREVRGERLVTMARALDLLDRRDAAATAYTEAAELLPEAADWLRLRAGALTDDPATRSRLLDEVTAPAAARRRGRVEAEARRRTGDAAGAARLLDSLGEPAAAWQVRLAVAGDSTAQATVVAGLLGLVSTGPGSAAAREAVAVLDSAGVVLGAADQLVVARSAARSGPPLRAADGYAAAFAAGLGTPDDRFAWAEALARAGRHAAAAEQFAAVGAASPRAGQAAYLRARSLVRAGRGEDGRGLLPEVVARYPADTVAAATSLYLQGDLASDERDDAAARSHFRDLVARYPTSSFAGTAAFRAALIALLAGAADSAAREFDALALARTSEATAARYWAGRAWLARGDTLAAAERWRQAMAREPASYYALLSARRLGVPAWTPPEAADSFVPLPQAEAVLARAAMLERIGLTAEADDEYDELAANAGRAAEELLALADAFRRAGRPARGIPLAQRALERGAARDARTYRLLYPLGHRAIVWREAEARGIDPVLMAALIRQESWFDADATSRAGARGLMQLMPEVGRQLAAAQGLPVWDPVLLWHPEVSLQFGAAHLADLHRRYPEVVRVLAAYNAGASRVDRWSVKAGVDDPEVFAERIPFAETRDYVRLIQRGREMYQSLYAWPPSLPGLSGARYVSPSPPLAGSP